MSRGWKRLKWQSAAQQNRQQKILIEIVKVIFSPGPLAAASSASVRDFVEERHVFGLTTLDGTFIHDSDPGAYMRPKRNACTSRRLSSEAKRFWLWSNATGCSSTVGGPTFGNLFCLAAMPAPKPMLANNCVLSDLHCLGRVKTSLDI